MYYKALTITLIVMISQSVLADCDSTMFAGGEGSAENPWQIAEADHLNNVRYCLSSHFVHVDQIDLDTAPYNEGEGWVPIGDSDSPFTGTYDGRWFSINDLFISSAGNQPKGLFGQVDGARIERVWLRDIDITSTTQTPTGGLVGQVDGSSEILDSDVRGRVEARLSFGGLVGLVFGDALIERCQSHVDVVGYDSDIVDIARAGGLVGNMLGGEIVESFSISSVSADDLVGGLVGEIAGGLKEISIRRSYSRGEVDGNTNVGGLIGSSAGQTLVADSFWDTVTSGQETSAGGTGKTPDEMTDIATFTDTETEGLDEPWNFDGLWHMLEHVADGYPFLRSWDITTVAGDNGSIEPDGIFTVFYERTMWFRLIPDDEYQVAEVSGCNGSLDGDRWLAGPVTEHCSVEVSFELQECNSTLFDGGSGTSDDPWQIATPEQLDSIRHCLDGRHFIQTADIDLGTPPWNEDEGWVPLGQPSSGPVPNDLEITYDGGGHAIANLTIDNQMWDQGLFSRLVNSEIRDLNLLDVNIQAASNTGALAAKLEFDDSLPHIERVHVSGVVIGSSRTGGLVGRMEGNLIDSHCDPCEVRGADSVGGLVGYFLAVTGQDESFISRSSSSGLVEGILSIGGLVGLLGGASNVEKSFSTASVEADATAGGLVGRVMGNVRDSYARGNVNANSEHGGAIGSASISASIHEIERIYSTGQVTDGDDEPYGGLVGVSNDPTAVSDSFWNVQTSGQSSSEGGTGKTTAEMQDIATFTDPDTQGLDTPWDFDEVWTIDPEFNDGYPYLRDNPPPDVLDRIFRDRFNE